ncbi:MAG: hypothetical protein ACPG5T_08635, partial [Endozoicomonas sp.]
TMSSSYMAKLAFVVDNANQPSTAYPISACSSKFSGLSVNKAAGATTPEIRVSTKLDELIIYDPAEKAGNLVAKTVIDDSGLIIYNILSLVEIGFNDIVKFTLTQRSGGPADQYVVSLMDGSQAYNLTLDSNVSCSGKTPLVFVRPEDRNGYPDRFTEGWVTITPTSTPVPPTTTPDDDSGLTGAQITWIVFGIIGALLLIWFVLWSINKVRSPMDMYRDWFVKDVRSASTTDLTDSQYQQLEGLSVPDGSLEDSASSLEAAAKYDALVAEAALEDRLAALQ